MKRPAQCTKQLPVGLHRQRSSIRSGRFASLACGIPLLIGLITTSFHLRRQDSSCDQFLIIFLWSIFLYNLSEFCFALVMFYLCILIAYLLSIQNAFLRLIGYFRQLQRQNFFATGLHNDFVYIGTLFNTVEGGRQAATFTQQSRYSFKNLHKFPLIFYSIYAILLSNKKRHPEPESIFQHK